MTGRQLGSVGLFLLLSGCGCRSDELEEAGVDLTRLLPAPSSLEGWNIGAGPEEYLPDDLYQYIDGAAPRYLTYGFRKLVHVRYEMGGDPLSSDTLDLFDMGSKLGAFGLYRSLMPGGAVAQDWGTEGHRSGTVAAAWKDRIYVQGEADDDRAVLISVLDRIMSRVSSEVPGDTALPAILASLPSEGRVPLSERYVAADLLGHTFRPGGVSAAYEIDGQEAELFFSDLGSADAAAEALASLRTHQSQWGASIDEVPSVGTGGFRFSDPGLGSGIAVRAGRYVAGVYGALSQDAQLRLLSKLVDRLGLSP
ncbi:MAG: hypothetical protein JSV80_01650 [Acidobacteriota bacterium]|nr:MAG: hypothetical protein JSV80_01650 [Acidobacteriota bacterium]